jgi:hypothetical protein
MPLVFVHGVNTRRGDTLEEQQVFDTRIHAVLEQFHGITFRERVTAPDGLRSFAPYWGDKGVTFARNLAAVPHGEIQQLAGADPSSAALLESTAANIDGPMLGKQEAQIHPILTLARDRSLGAALDLLTAGTMTAPVSPLLVAPEEVNSALPELARFTEAAVRYAEKNPHPGWLAEVGDDDAFIARLIGEVNTFSEQAPPDAPAGGTPAVSVQALGIGDTLKTLFQNAAGAVRNAVGSIVGAAGNALKETATEGARDGFIFLSGFARPGVSAFIGRFFGDVFTYMENRQPILDVVLPVIEQADAARRPGDNELYLVGHSFGGIILYDILSHFRKDLHCDLLVTVGSQVALFAEINRLADKGTITTSFAAGPKATVKRPDNVDRWVNVFDRTDLFGFGTKDVFSGVRDFQFDTDALPLASHSAYFDGARFYGRLRERVREAFTQGTDQS